MGTTIEPALFSILAGVSFLGEALLPDCCKKKCAAREERGAGKEMRGTGGSPCRTGQPFTDPASSPLMK